MESQNFKSVCCPSFNLRRREGGLVVCLAGSGWLPYTKERDFEWKLD